MVLFKTMSVFRITQRTNIFEGISKFHTSFAVYLNKNWRQKKGLPENPNYFGPLTNLPDYSFKDGKPTPYGSNQLSRIQKHQEYAKKIVKLVGEVDYAVERHARLKEEENARRQEILNNKLKPKGELLLKTNKES